MEFFKNYGLHDTIFNKVLIIEEGISLIFNEGIYKLKNCKEDILTEPCKLSININYFSPLNLEEHIEVISFRKNRFREIKLQKFIELLEENYFDVDNVFYSSFSNTILIKGFVGKNRIEFIVSEVSDIFINFI